MTVVRGIEIDHAYVARRRDLWRNCVYYLTKCGLKIYGGETYEGDPDCLRCMKSLGQLPGKPWGRPRKESK